jgi:hypothetical protein
MKKLIFCLVVTAFISTGLTKSQISQHEVPVTLEKLYGRLMTNFEDTVRLRINDSIRVIIESYIASDSVFTSRFTNLKYLGQISSSDAMIKIVTWNLVLGSQPGKYYCYLIKKSDPGKENYIYKLTGTYDPKPILTDTIYTQSDWYGALYYDIKPYFTDNRQCWILLGINYGNPLITSKVIEVLSFSGRNNIMFGRRWFDTGEKIQYRHVFSYSANGIMSLRFESDSSIVFDHLGPFLPTVNDDHQFYGPEYSTDSYVFRNGLWDLLINVDSRNKK